MSGLRELLYLETEAAEILGSDECTRCVHGVVHMRRAAAAAAAAAAGGKGGREMRTPKRGKVCCFILRDVSTNLIHFCSAEGEAGEGGQ